MFEKIKESLHLNSLVENTTHYVEARIALLRLEIMEAFAKIFTYLSIGVGVFSAFLMGFIMLNIALAFLISDIIGNRWSGALIIGLIWIAIGFIGYKTLGSESTIDKLRTKFLESILSEEKNETAPESPPSKENTNSIATEK